MLLLHLASVLFGAQVDGAKRVALAFEGVHDFGLDLVRARHRFGVGCPAAPGVLRASFLLLRDPLRRGGDGVARGFGAGLGCGAGLARRRTRCVRHHARQPRPRGVRSPRRARASAALLLRASASAIACRAASRLHPAGRAGSRPPPVRPRRLLALDQLAAAAFCGLKRWRQPELLGDLLGPARRASPSRRISSWADRFAIIVMRAASTVILTSSTSARAVSRSPRAATACGFVELGRGRRRFILVALNRQASAFEPRPCRDRPRPAERAGGFGHSLIGVAAGLPASLSAACQIGKPGFQRVVRLRRPIEAGCRTRTFLFESLQAVELFKTQRGGRRACLPPRRGSRPSATGRHRGSRAADRVSRSPASAALIGIDEADLAIRRASTSGTETCA